MQNWIGMTTIAAALTVSAIFGPACFGDDKPLTIRPEQAREHKGAKVSVTFEVKAAKSAKHRVTVFLDSKPDFRDEKNLGVAISEEGIKRIRQARQIDDLVDHFRNKTIRVVGVVAIREGRVYIDVDKASQIEEVAPEKSKSDEREEAK